MSYWILNPPEPTAAPTDPSEIGVDDFDLFGSNHQCGQCNAVPDTWLLTIPSSIVGLGSGSLDPAGYTADPGQTKFLLKRRLWTRDADVSPYVQRCLWSSDELVDRLSGAPQFNSSYNVDVLNFGTRNPRFVLTFRGFNSVFGDAIWMVFDHGWTQTIDGGQDVLGARWRITDDGVESVAQTGQGGGVLQISFNCLGRNRFVDVDSGQPGTMQIDPYFG